MLLHLKKALSDEHLARLAEMTAGEPFVDGGGTATGAAASVKRNLQLPPESEKVQAAGAYLIDCLGTQPLLQLAVQPRAFVQPLFSRYEVGMSYGYHLDSPILTRGQTIRSDVSLTVFLSPATDYDGGELVIDVGSESLSIKGDVGDCVVYPSSTFHRVAEVTRGVRLVSALWAQSLVRDPAQREILYDLGCVLQYFDVLGGAGGGAAYADRIRRSYNNLFRQWAEL
jgi:PKHD-type hydroxylase